MNKTLLLFLVLLSSQLMAQTVNYDSLSSVRKQLETRINEAYKSGEDQKVITYLKKLAETDQDTLLIAARAYAQMSGIFSYSGDSVLSSMAKEKQLTLIEQSLKKYPDNLQAYTERLAIYKYAEDKTGEQEFIKRCEQKFGNRWEMNFALAYHFVLYDFLWPESKDYDIAMRYLMKAHELNPKDFNTLFLLETSQSNPSLQQPYLQKMYALKPQLFIKTADPKRKVKYPYQITTKLQGKDLTTYVTTKQSQALKLIP